MKFSKLILISLIIIILLFFAMIFNIDSYYNITNNTNPSINIIDSDLNIKFNTNQHHLWTNNMINYCLNISSNNTNRFGIQYNTIKDKEIMYNHTLFIWHWTSILRGDTIWNVESEWRQDMKQVMKEDNPKNWKATHLLSEDLWFENFITKALHFDRYINHFGPFIPIFIEWTRLIPNINYSKNETIKVLWCNKIMDFFDMILKSEFLYITVIQHDQVMLYLIGKICNIYW